MNTTKIEVTVPEMPELIEQPNFNWRVRLPDCDGVQTFLSGPEYKEGEWVWLTQAEAHAAASQWWMNRLVSQFRPKITKQTRPVRPWWEADRAAGYKYND